MSSDVMRRLMNLTEAALPQNVTYFMNYADDGSIIAYPNEAVGREIEDFTHMGHTSVYQNTPIMPISYEQAVEEVGGEENLPQPVPEPVINQILSIMRPDDDDDMEGEIEDLDAAQEQVQDMLAEYTWFPD